MTELPTCWGNALEFYFSAISIKVMTLVANCRNFNSPTENTPPATMPLLCFAPVKCLSATDPPLLIKISKVEF